MNTNDKEEKEFNPEMIDDYLDVSISHTYPTRSAKAELGDKADFVSQELQESYQDVYPYAIAFTEGHCIYCGKNLLQTQRDGTLKASGNDWDHVLPKSTGGLFFKGNVVLACSACNRSRGDMRIEDFYQNRLAMHKPTYFNSMDEFWKNIVKFQIPFRQEHPEFFAVSSLVQEDPTMIPFQDLIDFYEEVIQRPERLSAPISKQFSKSPNALMWLSLHDKSSDYYDEQNATNSRRNDVSSRMPVIFGDFKETFKATTDIETVNYQDLVDWANKFLKKVFKKSNHSVSAVTKARVALREIFNYVGKDFSLVHTFTQVRNGQGYYPSAVPVKVKTYQPGTFSFFQANSKVYSWLSKSSQYAYSGPISQLKQMYEEEVGETVSNYFPIRDLDMNVLRAKIIELREDKVKTKVMDFFCHEVNKAELEKSGAVAIINHYKGQNVYSVEPEYTEGTFGYFEVGGLVWSDLTDTYEKKQAKVIRDVKEKYEDLRGLSQDIINKELNNDTIDVDLLTEAIVYVLKTDNKSKNKERAIKIFIQRINHFNQQKYNQDLIVNHTDLTDDGRILYSDMSSTKKHEKNTFSYFEAKSPLYAKQGYYTDTPNGREKQTWSKGNIYSYSGPIGKLLKLYQEEVDSHVDRLTDIQSFDTDSLMKLIDRLEESESNKKDKSITRALEFFKENVNFDEVL